MPEEKQHNSEVKNRELYSYDLSSKNTGNHHVHPAKISLSLYPTGHNIYFQKGKRNKGFLLYAKRSQSAVIK